MAAKMATMFGDVTGFQHMKYISSCRKDQRLSIEGEIFSKYCNISREGLHQSRPPPTSVGSKEQATYSKKPVFARLNSFTYNLGTSFNSALTELQTSSPTYWPLGH